MGEYVNSKQARFDRSYVSCGVTELHHLPNQPPAQVLFAIANNLYHKANGRPAAFLLWSDVVRGEVQSRGEALAEHIKAQGAIGAGLTASRKAINPRTGNVIQVYLWTLDHDVFRKWYIEEYANRISE